MLCTQRDSERFGVKWFCCFYSGCGRDQGDGWGGGAGMGVVRAEWDRVLFMFLKQKEAYEISECDWISDVCSSDLSPPAHKWKLITAVSVTLEMQAFCLI